MGMNRTNIVHKLKWVSIFLLLVACIDRMEFDTGEVVDQLVVEGMITDEPGPYKVILSTAFPTSKPERERTMETGAQVDLFEDNVRIGAFEESEGEEGVYRTSENIQGRVGKTYHIVITTADGKQYSSQPELMLGPGNIDVIYYDFESVPIIGKDGPTNQDRFNIYVNAKTSTDKGFTRWRLTGTYLFQSFPERAVVQLPNGQVIKAPLPCSGMSWDGVRFVPYAECTCCVCWVTVKETIPHLGNENLRTDLGFNNIKVGEVEVTPRTFYDSYRVEVEQFTLSQEAHEFFRLVEAQALGAGSLFQPSFGEIRGNIVPHDENDPVLGLFWAASVTRRAIQIKKSDVPYKVAAIDTLPDACTAIGRHSSSVKPDFWP
jgi:hypothetical protein